MAFDGHSNFSYSTVLTAPSPATSGTSLVVQSGDGAKFPTAPFNATIWPINSFPTTTNAEIVRVTAKSTDTFTITRTQESTSARTVVVGDQIAASITAKTLTDIESGMVVQMVSSVTTANATGTTTIPLDNTIPQNTEGDQYMSLAITPKSTANKLIIQVVALCSISINTGNPIAALFQDSTANALAATTAYNSTSTGPLILTLNHSMTAGTVAATTFKVRMGPSAAGTMTFNSGSGIGADLFGATTKSSIVIWEVTP